MDLPQWLRLGNVDGPNLQMRKAVFLTAAFYTSSTILQRLSGAVLSIHGGRPYPLTVAWGLASTCCSLMLANRGLHIASPTLNAIPAIDSTSAAAESLDRVYNKMLEVKDKLSRTTTEDLRRGIWSTLTLSPGDRARQEMLYHSTLGLAAFSALERRAFRTALPSSVITTGVYAHTPLHWRWSSRKSVVIATAEAATDMQRRQIQALGKIHGCHHCGSKQLLSGARFIADHMPPTKMVADMNKKWWRRVLGWGVKQQLLPQCQSCFSVQGLAVKQGTHRVIYHSSLRMWHAAPAVALLLLSDNEHVRRTVWPLIESADTQYRSARSRAKRLLESLTDR